MRSGYPGFNTLVPVSRQTLLGVNCPTLSEEINIHLNMYIVRYGHST